MIYILTGPIRSGKTTALAHWSSDKTYVDGILSPDDASGKRYFYALKAQHSFPFEAETDTVEDLIEIGRFKFLKTAFEQANVYLCQAITKAETRLVVLDELGKLELHSLGLYDAARRLIQDCQDSKDLHLMLVIRDSLLDPVLDCFRITNYVLLDTDSLYSLSLSI